MTPVCWKGEAFGASLGIGFDALVAKRALAAPSFLRGMPRYLYALFSVLKDLRLPEGRVLVDGEEVYRGRLLLLAAMNGPTYGGGIPIAPMADPRDGLLSLGSAIFPAHWTGRRFTRSSPT